MQLLPLASRKEEMPAKRWPTMRKLGHGAWSRRYPNPRPWPGACPAASSVLWRQGCSPHPGFLQAKIAQAGFLCSSCIYSGNGSVELCPPAHHLRLGPETLCSSVHPCVSCTTEALVLPTASLKSGPCSGIYVAVFLCTGNGDGSSPGWDPCGGICAVEMLDGLSLAGEGRAGTNPHPQW